MPAYAWIAIAVCAVAIVGGLVLAAVRGLAAWRDVRRFRRKVNDALAGATQRVAAMERRLAHANEQAERLDRARAELQDALATARALSDAAGEAKALVDRVRGVVPRR